MHVIPRKKGDFKRDNEIYEKLQTWGIQGFQYFQGTNIPKRHSGQ